MSTGDPTATHGGPTGVDVFVSYTGADEAWATWVAAALEAEGQTVRMLAWDSPAGTNFVAWINRQMTLAARTVAIYSTAYFNSHWSTQEWTGALAGNTLTPLRVEDCAVPPVLATIAYRDLHGVDEPTARRRLLEALGLATPARVSGGFPGRAVLPVGARFPGAAARQTRAARLVNAVRGQDRAVPGWPLADVTDPFTFGLEVHHAVTVPDAALPALPVYVSREHDYRLAQVVSRTAQEGASQIVVLVGGSSTGKTRACWEALAPLRTSGQPWRLWHPIDPTRPEAALAELDCIAPYTIVWLNEAQFYLAPEPTGEQVAAGLRGLLRAPDRGPLLILGTLWPDHWNTLTTRPATGPDRHAQARELLDGHNIPVPDAFAGPDLSTLTSETNHDPRLADAAEHARDGQITQYLAGAPVLLSRYQQAPPAAQALIHAAMDARRLGAGPHLPLAWLADATPGYLTDTAWNHTLYSAEKAGVDWFTQALDYATTAWNDLTGILTPAAITPRNQRTPRGTSPATGTGRMYRLADYLDQHGRRTRADQIPPIDFWTAAATHAHPTDLNILADAAWRRGLYRDATQLHKHATTHGNPRAAHTLIDHLRTLRPGVRRPATHAAAHAAAHVSLEDPAAIAELLDSLRRARARKQLITLADRATAHIPLEDPAAIRELLRSLRQAGAREQITTLLARDPAAHVFLEDPAAIAGLLDSLRQIGAEEQITTLLARDPAAHVFLEDPAAIRELLDSLRRAGAEEQITTLADRATAYISLDDPAAIRELLDSLRQAGQSGQITMLLARDPAAHVSLDNRYAIAELLDSLRQAGAEEQITTLADRATAHISLDGPAAIAELLDSLRQAGQSGQITMLLARDPAAHVALDDPHAIAGLLYNLRQMGAEEQITTLLARDPAAHVALDNPYAITWLLYNLRQMGAEEQITTLLARDPAAHVALDDPHAIAGLLDNLREIGAEAQRTTLADRATAHIPLDNLVAIHGLVRSLRQVGAEEQLTTLAGRLSAAGQFDRFGRFESVWERFWFGRDPDGSAAVSWTWEDLE